MKKMLFGSAVVYALISAGCGTKVSIAVDDINDRNFNDLSFAIFSEKIVGSDNDLDGVEDVDFAGIAIILSDQEDMCEKLAADPDALSNLPDVQAIAITAFKVEPLGESAGFVKGETITSNKGLFDILFDGQLNDTNVFTAITVREGGVGRVGAFDDGFEDVSAGELTIDKVKAGEELSATFSTTLTVDLADPARFDTDADGDGENDFQALSNVLEIEAKRITFCPDLQPF